MRHSIHLARALSGNPYAPLPWYQRLGASLRASLKMPGGGRAHRKREPSDLRRSELYLSPEERRRIIACWRARTGRPVAR